MYPSLIITNNYGTQLKLFGSVQFMIYQFGLEQFGSVLKNLKFGFV